MSKCNSCCGSCGSCGELTLAPEEIAILQLLGQVAFLPVMRSIASADPVCPEIDGQTPEQAGLALQCLEKRRLISIDFDRPLSGSSKALDGYPIQGSCGLTAKGQQVIELMEIHGIS